MFLIEKISFQLYSSRNFPPLGAQLSLLQRLGYTKVEPFGGLYGDLSDLKIQLNAHHLSAPTGHFSLDMLENDFDTALNIAKSLAISLIICPYLSPEERPLTVAGWQTLGARLGTICTKLAGQGLRFGWHNHDFEFALLPDGSLPLEHILAANPQLQWEADIGWIVRAGQDPLLWLARYKGRVAAVHVKDIAPEGTLTEDGWADVGHGQIRWPQMIAASLAAGAQVLVMEHDNPDDFERFARRSMATAKSW